ncbi:MAG: flagellar protein FlgN [Lachnospiraceae bacterium]|nr:flagellar protein FlgN [Lachnospiraceae bacterium]
MASLIENLITELNEEYAVYEKLLEVSMEKTSAIVSNNLDRLKETTDKEQYLVDVVTGMENVRHGTMRDIASVINKREELRVIDIADFLEGQPEFRNPLLEINEKLGKLAKKLKEVNSHNQNLINESLSMIEYNINLLQNLNRAPETAEYSKDMFRQTNGYQDRVTTERFDAKQ